jgi:UDP-N-acetylglucosamine acyltransferase
MLDTRIALWAGIHPSAIIHDDAQLAPDVSVGPGAVVGPGVVIGAGTSIGAHAIVERDTVIGTGCAISHGAVLGSDPQDLKYDGEETRLVVGDRTTIREYATLNRGTTASGETVVGSDCLVMAYAHVAHDCRIGDRVILANAVNMGGHVSIGDWAIIGGMTPIHQFVRVGEHAFIGGASRLHKDVPPYVRAAGNPLEMSGLNGVGLRRRGFSAEARAELKRAYRMVLASPDLNLTQALERARAELAPLPEVQTFLDFFRDSDRGIAL